MRRMFVQTQYRGKGIGRALADRVIADAKASNYHHIRLLTNKRQHEDIRLYERLGFTREPYPSGSGPTMGGDKGGCLG